MIEDETTPAEGAETPAEPEVTDGTPTSGPPAEPQPTDENGDVIAPPADDAPESPDAGNPPSDGSEVEYTGSGEAPEGEPADGVEVVDGEVVPASVGETQSSGEGGKTEVLSGDDEPNVLDSGNELPRHRQEVDGVH